MGTENILKPTIMNKSLYEMTIDNGNWSGRWNKLFWNNIWK
jgi:hypothetical protein